VCTCQHWNVPIRHLIFNLEVKVIREGMYTFSNASFVERGIAIDVLRVSQNG
jgi:hypothetical protein